MAPPFISGTIEKMMKKLGRNSEKGTTRSTRQKRCDPGPDKYTYAPDLGFGTSIFMPESRVSYSSNRSWFSKRSASRSTASLPLMVPYSGRRGVVGHTSSGPHTSGPDSPSTPGSIRPTTQGGSNSSNHLPGANNSQPSSNQQTSRRSRFTEDLPTESMHNVVGSSASVLGSYSTDPYPSIKQAHSALFRSYSPSSCYGNPNQS